MEAVEEETTTMENTDSRSEETAPVMEEDNVDGDAGVEPPWDAPNFLVHGAGIWLFPEEARLYANTPILVKGATDEKGVENDAVRELFCYKHDAKVGCNAPLSKVKRAFRDGIWKPRHVGSYRFPSGHVTMGVTLSADGADESKTAFDKARWVPLSQNVLVYWRDCEKFQNSIERAIAKEDEHSPKYVEMKKQIEAADTSLCKASEFYQQLTATNLMKKDDVPSSDPGPKKKSKEELEAAREERENKKRKSDEDSGAKKKAKKKKSKKTDTDDDDKEDVAEDEDANNSNTAMVAYSEGTMMETMRDQQMNMAEAFKTAFSGSNMMSDEAMKTYAAKMEELGAVRRELELRKEMDKEESEPKVTKAAKSVAGSSSQGGQQQRLGLGGKVLKRKKAD